MNQAERLAEEQLNALPERAREIWKDAQEWPQDFGDFSISVEYLMRELAAANLALAEAERALDGPQDTLHTALGHKVYGLWCLNETAQKALAEARRDSERLEAAERERDDAKAGFNAMYTLQVTTWAERDAALEQVNRLREALNKLESLYREFADVEFTTLREPAFRIVPASVDDPDLGSGATLLEAIEDAARQEAGDAKWSRRSERC